MKTKHVLMIAAVLVALFVMPGAVAAAGQNSVVEYGDDSSYIVTIPHNIPLDTVTKSNTVDLKVTPVLLYKDHTLSVDVTSTNNGKLNLIGTTGESVTYSMTAGGNSVDLTSSEAEVCSGIAAETTVALSFKLEDEIPFAGVYTDTLTFAFGEDVPNNVIYINTVAELQEVAQNVNAGTDSYAGKTVVLRSDLDLSAVQSWTPIGTVKMTHPDTGSSTIESGMPFEGTFDGLGHTISNLNVDVDVTDGDAAGLFGYVDGDGKVKNVVLKDVTVKSNHYAGAVVGYSKSANIIIENCHVIGGTIISTPHMKTNGKYDDGDKVGGIMGHSDNHVVVTDCSVTGVTIQAYRDIGGIIGFAGGSITDNVVKDVILVQDNKNGYKDETITTIAAIVGRGSATITGNTEDSVTIIKGSSNGEATGLIKVDGVGNTDEPGYAVVTPEGLAAMESLTDAGSGSSAVYLYGDLDLNDVEWTPINVDGYHGADIITVYGNGATITGLTAPLFAGGFAGESGIVIKDLTIADSNIVSSNTVGVGAFVESADSMDVITLTNCHLVDSTVNGNAEEGTRTGGLIGWASGYSNQGDGPVKTYVTITGCSVMNCEITGKGSVGGINGHAGASDWTFTVIEDCTVKDCTLISYDDSYRVGVVLGTANIGHVSISDITESGNTVKQMNGDTEISRPDGQSSLYGRAVLGNTGCLYIDGTNVGIGVSHVDDHPSGF